MKNCDKQINRSKVFIEKMLYDSKGTQ